jgi:hypothetical protein
MSAPTHAERLRQPGSANTVIDPDQMEVAPGFARTGAQGWVPELASEEDVRKALETAFDYRGDVTLTRKNGAVIEGYVFDRVDGTTLQNSFVRILPSNGGERQKIAYAEIAALAFTGRDTAAGKSWEAWVRKYWEKKAVGGEGARLEPEPLD